VIHKGVRSHAKPPQPLYEEDSIVTGKTDKAYLEFQEGGTVEIAPKTEVKIREVKVKPDSFRARFLIAYGKMKARVKKLTTSSSVFEIQAGGVVAGVRGTVFGVDYDKAKNVVNAQTFEGSIFTLSGGKEEIVNKGYSMLVNKTGLPLLAALSPQQIKDFTSFNSVSGLLEEKKERMINQMKGQVQNQIQDKVDEKKNELLKKVIPNPFGL
ncbi:MAG TPA: FecR family protein, partial [bacterium]